MRLACWESIKHAGVITGLKNVLDDLAQLILHHFTRALGNRGNRHEPCMAELPIMGCQHPRNMLERGRKDRFSADCAGETVESLFVHMRVRVVRGVFRGLKR